MEGTLTSPLTCYYDYQNPEGQRPSGGWPLVIGTHGYEGNKESMMRLVGQIAGDGMLGMSLQGPYQFFLGRGEDPKSARIGFGWGTGYRGLESVALHHWNMNALIRRATEELGADPERVFLVAFSQSCSYNYRFAFSNPGKVRGVAGVCGGIPGDWKENPIYVDGAAHVLHLCASQDQWYSPERNEQFRKDLPLRALSTDFRVLEGPHVFPREAIGIIREWIQSKK